MHSRRAMHHCLFGQTVVRLPANKYLCAQFPSIIPMRFDDFDLNYDVLDALDAMNFSECTPIQEQAIPAALDGHDLIAVAQTGTGRLSPAYS